MNFTKFLTEAKENKNVHLEHIEDEVLNGGVGGSSSENNQVEKRVCTESVGSMN